MAMANSLRQWLSQMPELDQELRQQYNQPPNMMRWIRSCASSTRPRPMPRSRHHGTCRSASRRCAALLRQSHQPPQRSIEEMDQELRQQYQPAESPPVSFNLMANNFVGPQQMSLRILQILLRTKFDRTSARLTTCKQRGKFLRITGADLQRAALARFALRP